MRCGNRGYRVGVPSEQSDEIIMALKQSAAALSYQIDRHLFAIMAQDEPQDVGARSREREGNYFT